MSRISFEEGVDLFTNADLFDLQKAAVAVRNEKNPDSEVTYVIDTNPMLNKKLNKGAIS